MKYLPKSKKPKEIYTRDKHLDNSYRIPCDKDKLDIHDSEPLIERWIERGNLQEKIDYFQNKDQAKATCTTCNSTRWIFCSKCNKLIIGKELLPPFEFPMKLAVYKHSNEKDKRSSVFPLRFFTQNSTFFDYPNHTD